MPPAATPAAAIAPGIYRDLPAEEYHKLPLASAHFLSVLEELSPAHLRHRILNPPEPTEAMRFGAAFHAMVLEPEEFTRRYVVAPKLDRRTKAGKEAWDALQNDGRVVVAEDDWAVMEEMADALRQHPSAHKLIQAPGDVEVSAVWEDRDTGVLCKGRADKVATIGAMRVFVDVKTCDCASPDAVQRAIVNYGYYRQGAHYLHGWAALGEPVDQFVLVFVEKKPPFGVACYALTDGAIEAGHRRVVELLAQWRECEERGVWPGYPTSIEPVDLPAWVK
jgi:hypothetical protein